MESLMFKCIHQTILIKHVIVKDKSMVSDSDEHVLYAFFVS